jgi:hypothetical protein
VGLVNVSYRVIVVVVDRPELDAVIHAAAKVNEKRVRWQERRKPSKRKTRDERGK